MTKLTRSLLIGIPVAFILLVLIAIAVTPRPMMLAPSLSGRMDGADGDFYAREEMMGYDQRVGSMPSKGVMGTPDAADSMMYPPVAPSPTAGETAAEVDQKIIKTGYLDLVVDDVSDVATRVSALASGKGGFVQQSSVSEREDGTKYGQITARVPSAEFESTMSEIKTYANVVETESSSGQDVTEQYTDLAAQLRNAQAQEEEYLKILEQAETVEEILQVQSYLSSVRYTIESLQGRIQYLENVTSYSTITVYLSEEPTVRIPTKEFRPGSTISEAFQALIAVAQNLVLALIWLVIVGGGILIPVALIAWAIVRIILALVRRSRK